MQSWTIPYKVLKYNMCMYATVLPHEIPIHACRSVACTIQYTHAFSNHEVLSKKPTPGFNCFSFRACNLPYKLPLADKTYFFQLTICYCEAIHWFLNYELPNVSHWPVRSGLILVRPSFRAQFWSFFFLRFCVDVSVSFVWFECYDSLWGTLLIYPQLFIQLQYMCAASLILSHSP